MSDGHQVREQLQIGIVGDYDGTQVHVEDGEREIHMVNSQGTGTHLLRSTKSGLGADIIRFAAGEGVSTHTHVGGHVLSVLRGKGEVVYDGVPYALQLGVVYLVESEVPHAVYADPDEPLVLLVVGDNHRGLADPARMQPVSEN